MLVARFQLQSLTQVAAPAGLAGRHAQPQEAERRLREYGDREETTEPDEDERHDVGQYVTPQDAGLVCARRARRRDVLLVLLDDRHHTEDPRAAEERRDRDHDLDSPQTRAKRGDER